MYEILMSNGVEVPRHMVVNRGEDSDHTDGECRSTASRKGRRNRDGGGGRHREGV